jgi:hypothetical protein
MADETGSEALAVLRGFMAEMNAWEVRHYPLVVDGDLERFEDARRDLGPIYERYVTSRERKMGKLAAGPSVGWPPEFDPEQESVEKVEVEPRKVVISTQQHTGFKMPCRYTLVRRGGRWLLDRKEEHYASKGKWGNAIL